VMCLEVEGKLALEATVRVKGIWSEIV